MGANERADSPAFRLLDDLLLRSGKPYRHLGTPLPDMATGVVAHEDHDFVVTVMHPGTLNEGEGE